MDEASADRAKRTSVQRAEDVVYTINHAIACTLSDVTSPFIGNWTQRYLGRRFDPGCGHDHHDHGYLGHYWIGEVAGDFAAVPLTLGLQRYAPGVMSGLRSLMEPALGPLFKRGAKRAAQRWALENSVAPGSKEEKEKQEQIYHYEIEHLPQAAVWTATSTVLNVATQKLTGNKGPLWQVFAGKLAGTAFSAAVVVGARTLAPGAAQRWESAAARKAILPATRTVSNLLGVDADTALRIAQEQEEADGRSWDRRMADKQSLAQAVKR
jgi:hypothetical protein